MKRSSLAALAMACVWAGSALAADTPPVNPDNLIPNGTFADVNDDGNPPHWPKASDRVTYPREDDNRFMRFHCVEPGKSVSAYRAVGITPGQTYTFSFRVRYQGVEAGDQPWFVATLDMDFRQEDHKTKVAGAPKAPQFKGTQAEWRTVEFKFTAPDEAVLFVFMPTLRNVKAGTVDFDSFNLLKTEG